jgi:6-phosphogluconolactonase
VTFSFFSTNAMPNATPRAIQFLQFFSLCGALGFLVCFMISSSLAQSAVVWIGGTANSGTHGILSARFDAASGVLQDAKPAAQLPGSSFLAVSPNGKFLYALDDHLSQNGKKTGGLSAFEIAGNGALKHINSATMGGVACHLSTDVSGRWLFAAAYSAGDIAVFSLDENGAIGEMRTRIQHAGKNELQGADAKRQNAPHPHQIFVSPDNTRVFVPDLGLDKVFVYDFDAGTGALAGSTPAFATLAPGAGPRHAVLHPKNNFLYVVNELDNTVSALAKTENEFQIVQSLSTLPQNFDGKSYTAELITSPDGKFLYATNRGHHSIAGFAVENDGTLKPLGVTATGAFPQHITFDVSGKWLLSSNRDARSIEVFAFEENSGALAKNSVLENLPAGPMCVVFAS